MIIHASPLSVRVFNGVLVRTGQQKYYIDNRLQTMRAYLLFSVDVHVLITQNACKMHTMVRYIHVHTHTYTHLRTHAHVRHTGRTNALLVRTVTEQ
jgi:hypothetical protein